MAAMDRKTGKAIDGAAEIEQAIDTILSTVPGDRVCRADYGSELFQLVDIPANSSGRARLTMATVEAIRRFETRVRDIRSSFDVDASGAVTQTLTGTLQGTSEQISVQVGRPQKRDPLPDPYWEIPSAFGSDTWKWHAKDLVAPSVAWPGTVDQVAVGTPTVDANYYGALKPGVTTSPSHHFNLPESEQAALAEVFEGDWALAGLHTAATNVNSAAMNAGGGGGSVSAYISTGGPGPSFTVSFFQSGGPNLYFSTAVPVGPVAYVVSYAQDGTLRIVLNGTEYTPSVAAGVQPEFEYVRLPYVTRGMAGLALYSTALSSADAQSLCVQLAANLGGLDV